MAITTLDGALAGMTPSNYFIKVASAVPVIGRPQSLWMLGGNPGAGTYDATLNGVILSSSAAQVAGQIPFTDPVSGNTYLARLQAAASQACTVLLCDRLWHNGGFTITSTAAQNITSPTWPARDNAGTTNGDGVLLGLEVSAACGAAAPTITVSYTNQAGTAGRTATNAFATANSPTIGGFFPIGLAAGDTGVRSVQSMTLSASWVSGTVNLVAYRVLAALELQGAYVPNAIDALTAGMPQMYNGSVPFLILVPSAATAATVTGQVVYTKG